MSKGLFVTGTGTDVGKTFIAALMVKKLRNAGLKAGYYKAAISGADTVADSDAGYANRVARIGQEPSTLVSYLYKNAVSPHLAARLEGNPVEISKVLADFKQVKAAYDYVTVEGSGGIVCPIRYDHAQKIFLENIIKALNLKAVIVADAGLGTINAVVLSAEYMKARDIGMKGVILNRYAGSVMQDDNIGMIKALTGLPIIARVRPNESDLDMDAADLASLYEENAK